MTYTPGIRAKLSAEDVAWIKKWYADGTFDKYELALIYNVNVLTISGIVVKRGRWKKKKEKENG